MDAAPSVVLLITAKHSGTCSVADLLCQSPDVDSWHTLNWIFWGDDRLHDGDRCQILHVHPRVSPRRNAFWRWAQPAIHRLLIDSCFPAVSTVRDPLGSLVSRRRRYPDFDARFVVDSIQDIRRHHQEGRCGKPFAIDLKPERCDLLEVFEQARVQPPENPKLRHVMRTKKSERPDLERAYKEGDLGYLMKRVPEIGYLRRKQAELRPWLETLGYSDLAWWE